jgi:hypothetical protein
MIYLLSQALQDVFYAVVEAMNKSTQGSFISMRRLRGQSPSCFLDLAHKLSKIFEVCFDLGLQHQPLSALHRGEPLHV